MEFRKLKADEIDIRVGTVGKKGVSLLLYQDARCAMTVLDEAVGAENWQRNHKEVKGNLFCGIGIKCGDEWVWKWDCGTESYTEKEKGESSDSMKRAAVNWGIGRELYTAPFIFVSGGTKDENEGVKGAKPKYVITDEGKKKLNGAYVSEITYNSKGEIETLKICDKDGNPMFSHGARKTTAKKKTLEQPPEQDPEMNTPGGVDYLENLIAETQADKTKLLAYYKVNSLSEMTKDQAIDCRKRLEAKLG